MPEPIFRFSNPASPIVGTLTAAIDTASMNAVLSPPAASRPRNSIVCVPAPTVKSLVV